MSNSAPGSGDRPTIRIGSIVIDCTNLERMVAFWTGALGYVPRGPPRPDGAILKDPTGRGPNLNLSYGGEDPLAEYRIHLDLYSTTPLEDVERLVRLGATVTYGPEPGHDFVTLADPDGNLFDVIDVNWPDATTEWSFGRRPSGAPSGP